MLVVFDWGSLREIGPIKRIAGMLATVTGMYAQFGVLKTGKIISGLPEVPILGWTLIVVFGSLTLFSLFVEIPFKKTYVKEKANKEGLVTTGTYALVRHPGVIWFSFFTLGLILLSRKDLVLIFGVMVIVLDIIHVILQDVYFFPRMFPGYEEYKQETPFLLPSLSSLKKCLRTLF